MFRPMLRPSSGVLIQIYRRKVIEIPDDDLRKGRNMYTYIGDGKKARAVLDGKNCTVFNSRHNGMASIKKPECIFKY